MNSFFSFLSAFLIDVSPKHGTNAQDRKSMIGLTHTKDERTKHPTNWIVLKNKNKEEEEKMLFQVEK